MALLLKCKDVPVEGAGTARMAWYQHQIELPAARRGCHLVTRHIVEGVPEIKRIRAVLLHLLQHTSASLAINENADSDVRVDLEASSTR